MISILLFFIAVILIVWGLVLFVKNFVSGLVELLAVLWYSFYDFVFVIPRHRKTKFFIDKTRQDMEKRVNKEQREENMRRTHIMGAMNFVTSMRVQYPLASEKLFKEATEQLPLPTCSVTPNEYEKLIKESHYENLKNQKQKQSTSTNKLYTLADLDDRIPIEVRKENPIIMSLYKINDDYLLWVANTSASENSLFQSKDYPLMASYMMSVIETQQRLREMKLNVTASQLEDIFKDKEQNFGDDFMRRRNLFG